MSVSTIKELGPLGLLAGTWTGDKGDDIAPSDDRGTENNKFREMIVFEPLSPVNNHEQQLHGLRYSKTAWRLTQPDPFHEEVGYWLWDPKDRQVIACFMVPRGVTVIAGGTVEANAKSFVLNAKQGAPDYGICSNKFLDKEFKTVAVSVKIIFTNDHSFSYEVDTQLKMPSMKEVFHHIDKNTLNRKMVEK